ncbi:hypothetical protein Bca4012_055936 [Brassica carinata]
MQTFQVRADENQCGCLNVVCSVARISGDSSARPLSVLAFTDSSVRGAWPDWPSDVDIQRFYMVDQSELLSTHWIRLYLELLLCIKQGKFLKGNISSLELVKVAIGGDSSQGQKFSPLMLGCQGFAYDLKPHNLLMDRQKMTLKIPEKDFLEQPNTQPQLICGLLAAYFAELMNKQAIFSGDSELQQLLSIFRLLGTPNEQVWPGVSKL